MSDNIFEDAVAEFLSVLPEEFVTHATNAKRELLLGVKSCMDDCLDAAVGSLDRCVELSKKKRTNHADRSENGARVTIEEIEDEDDGVESDAAPA